MVQTSYKLSYCYVFPEKDIIHYIYTMVTLFFCLYVCVCVGVCVRACVCVCVRVCACVYVCVALWGGVCLLSCALICTRYVVSLFLSLCCVFVCVCIDSRHYIYTFGRSIQMIVGAW